MQAPVGLKSGLQDTYNLGQGIPSPRFSRGEGADYCTVAPPFRLVGSTRTPGPIVDEMAMRRI